MIPFETVTLFFAASVTLAIAPGPDNLFVLSQSALHGRAAGWWVTLGLCTGLLVHTTLVAFGVAALVQQSAIAFTLLKLLGTGYLLYLAWLAFRAKPAELGREPRARRIPHKLYARGIIMNVTNPKVAMFFLAFLPQFADPGRGSLTAQLCGFGAIFIIATLMVFGFVAWSAGLLSEWLQRSRRSWTIMNRIAGSVFIALAIRLIVTTR